MLILIDKKTQIIICAGSHIQEYDDRAYIDKDTNTYYNKTSVTHAVMNDDDVMFDVLVHPSKYMIKNDTIIPNPSYCNPYIMSQDKYNQLTANVDYLMLLNDVDFATEEETE